MFNITNVRERTAHEPRQKTPTYRPENRLHGIDREVESRIQAEPAMHYHRARESGNGE